MSDRVFKKAQMTEVLREAASTFISNESNRTSMITITHVDLTEDFKRVTFFVTVFPENQEAAALDFLHRMRSECKHYIRTHTKVSHIPLVDFRLDTGEKSRQRIEEISREIA